MDNFFTLVQSSSSQSALSVLRKLIAEELNPILLFCLLYPPSSLVEDQGDGGRVRVFDWTDRVPGYSQDYSPAIDILNAVNSGLSERITVVIDSLDTLVTDVNSTSASYALLSKIRNLPSTKLLVHTVHPSITSPLPSIIPFLIQTNFSPSLTHMIAHPTSLILHISSTYLCPPPPLSPAQKFWSIFLPISKRYHEVDLLTFGSNGSGSTLNNDEFVVELLVRTGSSDTGFPSKKKRSVERTLRGWNARKGLCELKELAALQNLWTLNTQFPQNATSSDPTNDLSFNLNLTPSQQVARAQVPLPYAHQGHDLSANSSSSGAIFYDPDSADDIDDDDPDEDLDI